MNGKEEEDEEKSMEEREEREGRWRDGSQEGGRGKGVVREEEEKEWQRGKRERRSGKEGWAVEGEALYTVRRGPVYST